MSDKMGIGEAMALMMQWAEMCCQDDDATEEMFEARNMFREQRGFLDEESDPICTWLREKESELRPKREFPFEIDGLKLILSEPFYCDYPGAERHTEMIVSKEAGKIEGFRAVEADGTKRDIEWREAMGTKKTPDDTTP